MKHDSTTEPIAIVGMGCRFPGGITSPAAYWDFLLNQGDGIVDVPADRWDLGALYDPNSNKKGKVYTRKGGFLDRIDMFDPQFFGISPREAAYMDPQQRLLLEVAWEAFEDGGIVPSSLAGSDVGVFIGLFMHDYENIHTGPNEYKLHGPHSPTGMSTTIAANRISYIFDFTGPSMVVDTACSSSLVAIHLACESLLRNESSVAVAGGVNALIAPEMFMLLCEASMLSPDGYCKTFDPSANGYARAEGAGIVVLKRLSEAIAEGDSIYAAIRGSAVNQDGRSDGLTVPNGESQQKVMREALRLAGIRPRDIQYVEAHGTGTPVGDPIEAEALGEALSKGRATGEHCIVGSVKSNFGHTESAAGVAGIIKVALMLKHGQIPPNLHFDEPNPKIPFEKLKLRVPTELEQWPTVENGLAAAGVNSFGFGGTNAHVVLTATEPDSTKEIEGMETDDRACIVPVSGSGQDALRAAVSALRDSITDGAASRSVTLPDIAHTEALHRTQHSHRMTAVASSEDELVEALSAYLAGERRAGVSSGQIHNGTIPKVAFVFSGMGQQWWAMGRQLIDNEPLFRDIIEQCDACIGTHTTEWSLMAELRAEEDSSRVNQTNIAQPCIFAIQVALAALWRSWGVIPDAIIGHSVGEIAASHIAGVLSLEQAMKVCFHRSRLQQRVAGEGGMLAIGLSEDGITERLQKYNGNVSVAAINSPSSVTLAGKEEALKQIADSLESENVFAKFLKVEVPFHSPAMDTILTELGQVLSDLSPSECKIPFVSTVTGEFVTGSAINAEYWQKNVRRSVRFVDGMRTLLDSDHTLFIEISAHPVLSNSISECYLDAGKKGLALPSLRRKEHDYVTAMGTVGRLHCSGYPVDWNMLGGRGRFVSLPTYQWQRERYWNESEESMMARQGKRTRQLGTSIVAGRMHPLLGARIEAPYPIWQTQLDADDAPFLRDHVVLGSVVCPAAAYVEMALAAARDIDDANVLALVDIDIEAPLLLADDDSVPVQTMIDEERMISIHSRLQNDQNMWTRHVFGKVVSATTRLPPRLSPSKIKEHCTSEVSGADLYESFRTIGLEYGPACRGIQHVFKSEEEAFGIIDTSHSTRNPWTNYVLHPAVLDAAFQVLAAISVDGTYLPVSIDRIEVFRSPTEQSVAHARLVEKHDDRIVGDITIADERGNVLAEVRGLRCRRSMAGPSTAESLTDILYEYKWVLDPGGNDSATTRPFGFAEPISPTELEIRIRPKIDELSVQYGRNDFYSVVEPKIDSLCIEYIIHALEQLGLPLDTTDPFDTRQLAEQFGIAREHRRFFFHLFEMLEHADRVKGSGPQWQLSSRLKSVVVEDLWHDILLDHPDMLAELILIERCGRNLAAVLRGEVDPLELMFPGGSLVPEHTYQHSPTFRIYNRIVQQCVATLMDALPNGRKLRILEIGAGTGGMTSFVLPLLSKDTAQYTFTDISAAFLNQSEQKLSSFPFVEYQTLNIELDPQEQGFDPHSFDIVLASDAVHATVDLRRTLANIKKVMAPSGTLILLEATKPMAWFDLVFGTLKGWWLFEDSDLRQRNPLISEQSWLDLFESEGFVDAVALFDHNKEQLHSVLVAQMPASEELAPDAGRVHMADNPGGTIIVVGNESELTGAVVTGLESRGGNPVTVRLDNVSDIDSVLDVTCSDVTPIIVYLGATSPGAETTCGSLEANCNNNCIAAVRIVQALMAREWSRTPALWMVTTGAQKVNTSIEINLDQSPLWGLGRVIVAEYPNLETHLVDLGQASDPGEIDALCSEIAGGSTEDEIAFRGKERYVHRLMPRVSLSGITMPPEPFALTSGKFDSSDLIFAEVERHATAADEVEIHVHAAGVNFKDMARATGAIEVGDSERQSMPGYGLECAGVITAVGHNVTGFEVGDMVMGLAHNCFANYALTKASCLVHKPDFISFEEAATIPVAFMSMHYGLRTLGRVKKGDRVLIHSAAGGIGLAATQVARAAGATVLATAGNAEKRDFLRASGIEYVGDSRTTDFADEIMRYTDGEGVDIVVNTLPVETLPASISVLKPIIGQFIELSNIHGRGSLAMACLKKGVSLHAFDLETASEEDSSFVPHLLREVVDHVSSGNYHALPLRSYAMSEINAAFRCMSQARHIGKLVTTLHEPGVVPLPTSQQLTVDPDGTYIISGGLGGFGLAAAKWLVSCGAHHLVLLGRSGASTVEAQSVVETLRSAGTEIVVRSVDVTDEKQVEETVALINRTMPPLRGIIHAAMVLDDVMLDQMDSSQMRRVLNPKVLGAWNLHAKTLNCELDFFVSFSSFSSLLGIAGQGNYAAANAFLDSLADYRRHLSLPGLSICWGPIGEVGYVARHEEIQSIFASHGVTDISPSQAWQVITHGISAELDVIGVMPVDWREFSRYATWINRSPRLKCLLEKTGQHPAEGVTTAGVDRDITHIRSPIERREAIAEQLAQDVANVLGISRDELDTERPIDELGFDSLMAPELGIRIDQTTGLDLPKMTFLRPGLTVSSLVAVIDKELSRHLSDAGPPAVDVDGLSDDDVNALLDAMTSTNLEHDS